jgi:hypothetical protein
MLEKALKAFETHDLILAMQVVRADDDLYEGFRAALRRISTFLIEDACCVGCVVDIVAQEDRASVHPAAGRPRNGWNRDRRMPGTKYAFLSWCEICGIPQRFKVLLHRRCSAGATRGLMCRV